MDLGSILQKIENERGGVASIHGVFSEFPQGIIAHYEFYQAIFLGENLPLSRFEREYLAVETSKQNVCPYCIGHHEEALKNQEYQNARLIGEEKREALSNLAQILTQQPYKASVTKPEFLRVGYKEEEFQHAVFVVSYFNLANRLAHAMDLDLEPDFEKTCS